KKFIALDIKTARGMEILRRLLADADAFITNIRMDALKRINLTYEDLAPQFPKLVYGHITGFGYSGPDASNPGFDVVAFWARSGLMLDIVPAEANLPTIGPTGFGDHATGMVMVGGICSALYRAARTGKGDMVSIALYGAGIFQAGTMIVPAQPKYGQRFPKLRSRPNIATVHPYECKDKKWIMLAILEFDRYWPVLCQKVLGRPELAADERFFPRANAVANSPLVVSTLEKEFITRDADEWAFLLREADIAFDRVAHFRDVAEDQQAWANDFVFERTYRNGNTGVMTRTPVKFKSMEVYDPPSDTRSGAHTRGVLLELGYTKSEIDDFADLEIVKCAP
ncbi:MAG: CoA transferase, partial [Syntrophales bacterium]|nr:CoA transferase [Syntrophales bacterium]